MTAPTITLNDGLQLPVLGLGTYKVKEDNGEQAIRDAIDAGYRHIDTAFFYGNEKEVGNAVRDKIREGVIKREDVVIVTKLWNSFHSPELVRMACQKSVDNLNLGPIDLYLMHTPMAFAYNGGFEESDLTILDSNGNVIGSDIDYLVTWKEMEKCKKDGLVRSIGISNFNSEQIDRLLSNCEIKPTVNQVECSPYLNQLKLIEFCKSRDIALIAYCPIGRPHVVNVQGGKSPLSEPKVQQLAEKYNKTPTQIVLKFLIQNGTLPIPKSGNKGRIIENINIFDFTLSDAEVDTLKSLNTNHRMVPFTACKEHLYFPLNIEF